MDNRIRTQAIDLSFGAQLSKGRDIYNLMEKTLKIAEVQRLLENSRRLRTFRGQAYNGTIDDHLRDTIAFLQRLVEEFDNCDNP